MLITVGTTKFENLIKNIDKEEFYKFLDDNGFTKLVIQKGHGDYLASKFNNLKFKNLVVEQHNLMSNFETVVKESDYIISHAGAGNILEGLKNKKHLIIIVNDTLMDNHQIELAEALEKDNYISYIKNVADIIPNVQQIITNKNKLTSYPDFDADIIPRVIYEMLNLN
jgi:beta-1,4-N-acetylglucosaminyltransferase